METCNRNKTAGWVTIIIIIVIEVIVIPSMLNNGDQKEDISQNAWQDPGVYKEKSSDWPYFVKTNDELLRELNEHFSNESGRKIYDKIGGMLVDKVLSNKARLHYDFIDAPIRVDYKFVNGLPR